MWNVKLIRMTDVHDDKLSADSPLVCVCACVGVCRCVCMCVCVCAAGRGEMRRLCFSLLSGAKL